MVDAVGKPPETAGGVAVRRLMVGTGITDAQASELVSVLGPYNWSSLLREARILNPLKSPPPRP